MLTYHVAPRFDIAAEGGPLALGTVVANLETLVPLNGGPFHRQVPDGLVYPPVLHTDFQENLLTARQLNVKGWAKFLGLPLSAAAGIEKSTDLEQGVECESVTTTYFDDPMGSSYIKQCLDVASIHEWLDCCEGYAADLYVVTGLKVAKKLKFNKASGKKTHADMDVSGKESHTQTEAGLKAEGSNEEKKKLGFSVVEQDIVIGYRVNKYHCTRKWLKNWTKKDVGILEGNMQGYGNSKVEGEEAVLEVELAVIDGESAAQEAAPEGATECWVGIDG